MSNKLKILMIGTIDNRGGAARVSWTLGQKMRQMGHDVQYVVGWKYSKEPYVHELPKNRFYYWLNRIFPSDLIFSKSDSVLNMPCFKEADIVHFHNIHSGFFNWSTFDKIISIKPSVWTIHDIWPITGGETTAYELAKNIPRRIFGFFGDIRKKLLARKTKTYEKSSFHLVYPSVWIETQVKQNVLGNMPSSIIPNPIDTEIFYPRDKKQSREYLHLPQDKKIILFVAPKGTKDKLKGSQYIDNLVESFKSRSDCIFIKIGGNLSKSIESKNIITIGNISDNSLLSAYYSSADVFAYPSLADSFGLVVAESMACGTPCVVFNTDALPELVRPELGRVVQAHDMEKFALAIDEILSLNEREEYEIRLRCSEYIHKKCQATFIANMYIDEYNNTISDYSRRPEAI